MNQKKISSLIVLGLAALASWFFNQDKNSTSHENRSRQTQSTQTQNTSKSARVERNNEVNNANDSDSYDTIMAQDSLPQNADAPVSYYTLALSWSPAFCDLQKQRNHGNVPKRLQYQCGGAQQFGWVIHGLWPQNANARSVSDQPRYCKGDLAPVSESVLQKYLPESPGLALLQGEWEKHGACAFDNAEAYFSKQQELFNNLLLPDYSLSRKELFQWMKANNPQLNGVYLGASKSELYICYDKNWQPMDCPKAKF